MFGNGGILNVGTFTREAWVQRFQSDYGGQLVPNPCFMSMGSTQRSEPFFFSPGPEREAGSWFSLVSAFSEAALRPPSQAQAKKELATVCNSNTFAVSIILDKMLM